MLLPNKEPSIYCLAPNVWLDTSVGSNTHLVSERYGFKFHRGLNFFWFLFCNFLQLQPIWRDGFSPCRFNEIYFIKNCHNLLSFTFTFTYHIPASFVLSTSTGLFGPSPLEVSANTWNSYSVNLSSPVTFLLNIDPLPINNTVADPPPFFL